MNSLSYLLLLVLFVETIYVLYKVILSFKRNKKNIRQFIMPFFIMYYILPSYIHLFKEANYAQLTSVSSVMADSLAYNIYLIFVIILLPVLWYKKPNKKMNCNKSDSPSSGFNNKYNKKIADSLFILSFVPIVFLLLSPSYIIVLFLGFGSSFVQSGVSALVSDTPFQISLYAFCIFLTVCPKKDKRVIWFSLIALLSIYMIGKRYAVVETCILVIIALYLSDKINVKTFLRIVKILVPFCFIFLYVYTSSIKGVSDLGMLDFFDVTLARDYNVVYAIYCELYNISILNYRFETILYNLFIFIPRSLWVFKPYPYAMSLSYSMMGYHPPYSYSLTWATTTEIFGEFIANLSIAGIFVAIFLYKKMMSFAELKISNIGVKMFFIIILIRLFSAQFATIAIQVIIIGIVLFFSTRNIKLVRN